LDNLRAEVDAELGDPVEDPVWDMLTDRGDVRDLELRLTAAREVAAMIRRIRMAGGRSSTGCHPGAGAPGSRRGGAGQD
jgi:hypothetical protein